MKIFFTPRARRRVAQVDQWWRENRPGLPVLFEHELETATKRILDQPELGQLYDKIGDRVVRRLLLVKTEQHVYYFVDHATDKRIVITIWGARRGRGPKL